MISAVQKRVQEQRQLVPGRGGGHLIRHCQTAFQAHRLQKTTMAMQFKTSGLRCSTHWSVVTVLLSVLTTVAGGAERTGGDWPMWRYDARRSAAAAGNSLPDRMQLLWTKQLGARTQAWDDPLNLGLMTYDRVFEPVVMGGRLFVGFNDRDRLTAFDTESGRELWSAWAEGPVRLPPVAAGGRVFFCSDDGCLYCVNAADGSLHWKFCGAANRLLR